MTKRFSSRQQLGRQAFAKRPPEDVVPDPHGNRAQRRAFERLYGKGADWSDADAIADAERCDE